MPFGPRNAYYLRISRNSVLPLYLYLDERHLDWMSDVILQHVLADLKPRIPVKLEAEAGAEFGPAAASSNAKRGSVDVHRGETYQFAYFLRKVESHSVLVKARNFTLASTKHQPVTQAKVNKGKRKPKALPKVDARKRPARRQAEESSDDADEPTGKAQDKDDGSDDNYSPTQPHNNNETALVNNPFAEVDSDEESKPKPILQLSYQNFDISGCCLCVIVEPWPLDRAAPSRAFSKAPSIRGSSIAPSDFVTSDQIANRGRTPLFLPDDDEETNQPSFNIPDFPQKRVLPPVPAFDEEPEDENAELLQFSQILNSKVGHGETNDDDDDFDGAVLFGDADEVREL